MLCPRSSSRWEDRHGKFKIETIRGRQYISAHYRWLNGTRWATRSWTYQEGQLARRIAFFNDLEISFFCSSGQWRESAHSGIYGHEVNVVNIDLKSCGYSILSASRWLESTSWDFEDYQGIIFFYSRRDLTYEFDKLNAISGCLNLQKKESNSSKACLRWTSTTHCFSTKTVPNAEKASQVGAGQDGLAV